MRSGYVIAAWNVETRRKVLASAPADDANFAQHADHFVCLSEIGLDLAICLEYATVKILELF